MLSSKLSMTAVDSVVTSEVIVSLRSKVGPPSCHLEEDGLLAESVLRRGAPGCGELDLDVTGGMECGFESIEFCDGDILDVSRLGGYDVRL